MAKLTKGYSYAYQLLGSLVYENDCILDNKVISKYDKYLEDYVYDKMFADLVNDLKISSKDFSPYRDRLIKKGLLVSDKPGEFSLTLPRLKEYINNKQLFY